MKFHLFFSSDGIADPIISSDSQGLKRESIEYNVPLLFSLSACKTYALLIPYATPVSTITSGFSILHNVYKKNPLSLSS